MFWRNALNTIAVLGLILAIMVIAANPAFAKGPKIVFKETELNLPISREGQILTAKFEFTNEGDEVLIIKDVSPSCGCTASSYTKQTRPGEKGNVTLTLDTEGIMGYYRKTAVVATNDPTTNFVNLLMRGTTKSSIKIDKGRRIRLAGCLNEVVKSTATLSDPDGKPFLIKGLENPMEDYLEASLQAIRGGRAYLLKLRSITNEAVEFAGPLFLKLANGTKVSVYVSVDIKGEFWVQPQEVYFGAVSKSKAPAKRLVMVKNECADSLFVQAVEHDERYLKVANVWEKKGQKLFLEVSPNLETIPLGPFTQFLTIKASGKQFKVRLSGRVSQ